MTPQEERDALDAYVRSTLKKRSSQFSGLLAGMPAELRSKLTAGSYLPMWRRLDRTLQRLRKKGAIHFGNGAWHLGGAA